MYLVLNQSKRLITVSDLDVSIPAGTMLDLDKYKKNKYLNPRDSKDLQEALRRGLLRTMKNDSPAKKDNTVKPEPTSHPDMTEMMKMMKETIREEMEKNKTEHQPEKIAVQHDDSKLIEMMSDIKSLIAKGSIKASDMDGLTEDMLIDDSIDENKLKEIHAAAMKKMKNKTKSKSEISYDTNVVKDESISDNIGDLEGLI